MTVGHRGEKVQVQYIRVWTCHSVGGIVVSSYHVSITGQVTVGVQLRLDLVELAARTSTLADRTGQSSMFCILLQCADQHCLVV